MPEIVTAFIEHLENPDCDNTPSPPPKICVRLPFGLEICSGRATAFLFEGRDRQLLSFLGVLQPVLTPLMMLLVIASLVKALVDCIKAIPEAIASLSPSPIINCIEKLTKIFPKLLSFIPPLTYIATLIDIIRAIILLIDTFIESIELTLEAAQRALLFETDIEVLPELGVYKDCVDNEIATQYDQIAAMLNASGPIFTILGQFLDLLDIPPLKPFIGPLQEATAFMAGVTSTDISSDLISDLNDVQRLLKDIDAALAPFGGYGSSSDINVDLS